MRRETGETRQRVWVNVGLVNNSDGVAYDVAMELSPKASTCPVYGYVHALGPGMWHAEVSPPLNTPMPGPALDIYFTDHKGVSWRRHPDGALEEMAMRMKPAEGDGKSWWRTIPISLGQDL